jgi:4-hydroxyphenylpyruvate dioxygenase-like putative hemolysin
MNIHVKRLDHVQICIPVGAEDEARAFYSGILDFKKLKNQTHLKRTAGYGIKLETSNYILG